MEKYYVYVIRSVSRNYTYTGMTNDVNRRVSEHNNGYNKTTKPYAPFVLILVDEKENRVEARKREKYLKSGVGREWIKVTYLSSS